MSPYGMIDWRINAMPEGATMRVYAVALEKGGCGKTALAVNLAAAFHHLNLEVLLVDLDSQGSASHWLGVDTEQVSATNSVLGLINDGIKDRVTADSVLSRTILTPEGVHLLPAHDLMTGLPAQLAAAPLSGLFLLQQVFTDLAQASAPFDVVVLDLPPARGPVLAMALAAATRCLIPVQPEDLVVRAVQALMTSAYQIRSRSVNASLQMSLIRNKYAPRSNADKVLDQLLRDDYGALLLQTIFPIRASLRDSALLQQSVFRYSSPDVSEVRSLFVQLVGELARLDGA
ncbi:MAG: ParA family protein [Oscillochloris sp.]|nr:ParA family protein [Oscillochloris sp.]